MDLFENQMDVPIGANISIRDYEPLPGLEDDASEAQCSAFGHCSWQVEVEIFVGDGQLHMMELVEVRGMSPKGLGAGERHERYGVEPLQRHGLHLQQHAGRLQSLLARGSRACIELRRCYEASASRRQGCTTAWCTWRSEWPCATRRSLLGGVLLPGLGG